MLDPKPHSINIIEFTDKGWNLILIHSKREDIKPHRTISHYVTHVGSVLEISCIYPAIYSFDIMTINYPDNDGEIAFEMT